MPPVALVDQVIVPDGVLFVPAELSVTVAVQAVVWGVAPTGFGKQLTVVVVVRLFTMNVRVTEVPPPGPEFVTEKFRFPVVALSSIVMFAVREVELLTVIEFTIMPE